MTSAVSKKWFRGDALTAWLFMAPGLLLVALFIFWPIIYSIPLALTDYSVIGETSYVGFKNFERAINDPDFRVSLLNSFIYVLIVPFIQVFSILMAILVNSSVPGVKWFRTAYYIPVVTSMVAVSLIWGWLLSPNGVVNYLLLSAGLITEKISWLSSASTALYTMMFVTMWKGLGYYMMIYLAGLQSVPKELTEAAMIDGASRSQIIRKITIPMLRPYVLFCTLISLMAAMRVFDEVFVMSNGSGGPGTATLTSSLYIYNKGFKEFDFGYASAVGLIVSLILGIMSVIVFRFNSKGGVNSY
ncbi:sugar ABC transporter permease [Paenibacillus sp. GD4]|jgi:putative chitobiose transport system permease protein|uniref:carbohydrate ABC transporter permease n=1 Tax=Paenibacillus sp. GD4 TaxID=3068890 RepID=UPI0027966BFA|nr:sugar ABC transporter permease [Paenibacillus sp. GD4]MDQ1911834.1 sugar ABC transporter permease [Paenibacillus sp. GD4]